MVSMADPDFVESITDVAVMVTTVAEGGAANKPEEEIAPVEARQVTEESKLPVPCTVAAHWSVSPATCVETRHETATEEMVGDGDGPPEYPPPQALHIAATRESGRTITSLRTVQHITA